MAMQQQLGVFPVRRQDGGMKRLLTALWDWLRPKATGRPAALRHNFVITHLGQADGWIRPHRYRYLCVRCRWEFRIETRRGDAFAVGPDDRPIIGEEGRLRVATFASGPCPGLPGHNAVTLRLVKRGERRSLRVCLAVQSKATAGRRKTR